MTWYLTDKKDYLGNLEGIGKVYREVMGRNSRRWPWSRSRPGRGPRQGRDPGDGRGAGLTSVWHVAAAFGGGGRLGDRLGQPAAIARAHGADSEHAR